MKGRIVYQFLSGRIAPKSSVGSRRTPVASICTFGSGTAFPEGTCEIAQVGLQREAAKSGGRGAREDVGREGPLPRAGKREGRRRGEVRLRGDEDGEGRERGDGGDDGREAEARGARASGGRRRGHGRPEQH